MKHPNPNMLLRIAQADSYGMACEYLKHPRDDAVLTEALTFQRYCRHPVHNLRPGQYTDDTQMSLAVAEILIESNYHGMKCLDPIAWSEAFYRVFKRDPRDGYSRGFQTILESSLSPADLVSKLVPNSDKNGAAMRSVPLGVLPTVSDVFTVARVQASITHMTPGGVLSSQIVGLMSHFALWKDGPLSQLPEWLAEQGIPADDLIPWNGSRVAGPGVGMLTARAVLTLVSREPDLMSILKRTLEWGGDTDSVAAIAWGIASTRMKEDVPYFLETTLEPGGKYGVQFLKDLGQKLMTVY